MPSLGIPELLIILVIIVVIFGVGRLPEIGGALGKSIREFRSATTDEEKTKKAKLDAEIEASASDTSENTEA
ncbi:MAG TPA: twin-arginine translocase TatA/TatE family subunit [Chloroflexi bacterium]|nr:twin-arginine translocase TatA/TatE family subunit [Chloroflexota bacterium]